MTETHGYANRVGNPPECEGCGTVRDVERPPGIGTANGTRTAPRGTGPAGRRRAPRVGAPGRVGPRTGRRSRCGAPGRGAASAPGPPLPPWPGGAVYCPAARDGLFGVNRSSVLATSIAVTQTPHPPVACTWSRSSTPYLRRSDLRCHAAAKVIGLADRPGPALRRGASPRVGRPGPRPPPVAGPGAFGSLAPLPQRRQRPGGMTGSTRSPCLWGCRGARPRGCGERPGHAADVRTGGRGGRTGGAPRAATRRCGISGPTRSKGRRCAIWALRSGTPARGGGYACSGNPSGLFHGTCARQTCRRRESAAGHSRTVCSEVT